MRASRKYCLVINGVHHSKRTITYCEYESVIDGFCILEWMPHISVDVGEDTVPTPRSLRVLANLKTHCVNSSLPINRPKLNGNVDHLCGNKDVGAGSRSDPGE